MQLNNCADQSQSLIQSVQWFVQTEHWISNFVIVHISILRAILLPYILAYFLLMLLILLWSGFWIRPFSFRFSTLSKKVHIIPPLVVILSEGQVRECLIFWTSRQESNLIMDRSHLGALLYLAVHHRLSHEDFKVSAKLLFLSMSLQCSDLTF